MKIVRSLAATALILVPTMGWAQDFDGTSPLLCASVDAMACAPGEACTQATVEELNVPQFLRVDVAQKLVSTTRADGEQRTSEIQSLQLNDGELIMQGTQGGLAWSAAIARASGKLSLSAVGDRVAFVIFGACTAL